MKQIACFWMFLLASALNAQVSITATNYFQNFGTSNIATWTNNSTFPGWYLMTSAGADPGYGGYQDVSGWGSPPSTGAGYIYHCSNNNKLGTRPSNAHGGPCTNVTTCGMGMGVRLLNNTGSAIDYIQVTYTGHQFSTTQNGNNSNLLLFHYLTGATVTTLIGAGWVAVPALNYTAPIDNATCGGTQTSGSGSCTRSTTLTACFAVTLNNNQEIMLRWWDSNNSCDDPHLGIDDVSVLFFPSGAPNGAGCVSALPVELINFDGEAKDTENHLHWQTASENETDLFVVERSTDGELFSPIGEVNAANNSSTFNDYMFLDQAPLPGVNYYRLRIVDANGSATYTEAVVLVQNPLFTFQITQSGDIVHFISESEDAQLQIYSMDGRMIRSTSFNEFVSMHFSNGIYLAVLQTHSGEIISKKFVVAQ